jgi:hypothetical protein
LKGKKFEPIDKEFQVFLIKKKCKNCSQALRNYIGLGSGKELIPVCGGQKSTGSETLPLIY